MVTMFTVISAVVLIFLFTSGGFCLSLQRKNDPPPTPPKPIVIWHGMGDNCCNPLSVGYIKSYIEQQLRGVYVLSLMIGKNIIEDTENGYFMNVNHQVEYVCRLLASDDNLTQGYNAIGLSQGAQFLRAVAQRCPSPRMHNLISLGGQHQGVYGLPHCFYPPHKYCDYMRSLINIGAYWGWVQNELVQAEYWHDPMDEDKYKQNSVFIAEINNEIYQNNTYKENLLKLDNFVLVKFEYDKMVEPHESSWFGFYTPGQAVEITPLNQSKLYIEDRLGLQQLDQSGRLQFLSVPGDHLQFTIEWFKQAILDKYLS
ncbi:palmitoyl-protein thioesterase 1-like isoform X1 [Macrosteles quadrilineatus]|uniref:palmitoyl-protein thioesterase 1-like isoform X1 n=1 Tax=Macrosteles quadrilineatus TaxID=74068 RepID=UPI0023E0D2B3|nr:palmitoyl-protein thioesterase 1-like isoform X1 [Macrosteles quadrilineatus]